MNPQTLTFAVLVGMPVVAAVSLGLFARGVIEGGRPRLVWLLVAAASGAIWLVFVRSTP